MPFVSKETKTANITQIITALIENLKEFNETHREELTDRISQQIKEVASSKAHVRAIIEETEIGQRLFRNLQKYINTRYSSLLELVKSDLGTFSPPSASGRLSFEAGILGNFPITQTALSTGITKATVAEALTSLLEVRKPREVEKSTAKGDIGKRPDQITHIERKREILSQIRKSVKREIERVENGIPLENILSRRRRMISNEEYHYRAVALINLLIEYDLKIEENEDGQIIIRRGKWKNKKING